MPTLHDALNEPEFRRSLAAWLHGLEENRGARAELRRCKSHRDVYISRAFRRGLLPWLEKAGFDFGEAELERLALPVGVLAHAKTLTPETQFPRLLGKTDKGSEDMRDVRFRKLLSIADSDREGLYAMLVRLVRLLDGTAHVPSVIRAGAFWNDKIRRDWAEAYYSVHNK